MVSMLSRAGWGGPQRRQPPRHPTHRSTRSVSNQVRLTCFVQQLKSKKLHFRVMGVFIKILRQPGGNETSFECKGLNQIPNRNVLHMLCLGYNCLGMCRCRDFMGPISCMHHATGFVTGVTSKPIGQVFPRSYQVVLLWNMSRMKISASKVFSGSCFACFRAYIHQ